MRMGGDGEMWWGEAARRLDEAGWAKRLRARLSPGAPTGILHALHASYLNATAPQANDALPQNCAGGIRALSLSSRALPLSRLRA